MAESAATDTHKMPGHRLRVLFALLLALMVAGAPLHSLMELASAEPAWSEPGMAAPDPGSGAAVWSDEFGPQIAKLETPQQLRAADKKESGSGFGPQAEALRPGGVDPPSASASRGRASPMAASRHGAAPYILPSPTGPPILHA